MAGEGRKVFSDGEVLSAADVNDYLMDQAVMRFADSAARSSAIGTPTEGMVSYLDDTNDVEVYDGSQWVNFTGDITNITAGTGLTGGGSEGAVTLDVDYDAVVENVITTEGDLIVGGTGGAYERLGIGGTDTVLTSDGTAISWAAAGGGVGDWTKIVTSLSMSGASTIEVTGLSGYSDYMIRCKDVSFTTDSTTLEIDDINGQSGGGISGVGTFSDTFSTVNENGLNNLLRVSGNSGRGDLFMHFEGAGSTAPARCFFYGGSNSSGGANRQVLGQGIVAKNNAALDTIKFASSAGTIDVGTIDVWAR